MIVYAVENTVNNKLYIGATKHDLGTRFAQHVRHAKSGSDFAFHCAIRKYGEDAFEPSILARASSKKEMYELEKEYIELFNTYNGPGYNMTEGGDAAPSNSGEDHWNCKLGEEDVLEIRTRYASNEGVTQEKLAREFGVDRATVSNIVRGKAFPDAGGPITERGYSRLTKEEVAEIRKKYANGGVTYNDLANEYGIGENAIGKIVRGRNWPDAGGPISEDNGGRGNPILTEAEVVEIREKYANGGVSYADLANEYSTGKSTIGRIVKGESWPDAGGPIKGEDYS